MRKTFNLKMLALLLLASATGGLTLRAADWPEWGAGPTRNMVSPEKSLPTSAKPGDAPEKVEDYDLTKAENVKWLAKLGNQAYGNTTVAGGKVFVGTNNGSPRNPAV